MRRHKSRVKGTKTEKDPADISSQHESGQFGNSIKSTSWGMVGFKDVGAIMRATTVVRYQVGTIYVRGAERRTIWENHGFAVSPPGILKPIRFRDYAPVYSKSHLHLTDSEPSSRGFKASFSKPWAGGETHPSPPLSLSALSILSSHNPSNKVITRKKFGFKYDSSIPFIPCSTKRPWFPILRDSINNTGIHRSCSPPLCNQRYSYVLRITAA